MAAKQTIKETLKACHVFSALEKAELDEIAALATEKPFEAGTILFQQGDPAEEFLVLEDGKVAVQMNLPESPQGTFRRATIDTITRNEVVGWSVVVEPYIYTLTAICLQNVNVLSLNGQQFRALLEKNHKMGYEIMKRLMQVVASRLDDTRHVLISERLSPADLNKIFS